MSIQSEINRIKSDISSAYNSVQSMGGTLPSSQVSSNLANAIASIPSIPTGGSSGQFLSKKSNTNFDTQWVNLPTASSSVLGGVKVGSNLTIDANGVLNGTPDTKYTLPKATYTTLGGVMVGSGLFIDSITGSLSIDPNSLPTYTLPIASSSVLGGVKQGVGLLINPTTGKLDIDYALLQYIGSSSAAAGSTGLVPAAAAGTQNLFLRADGTWVNPLASSPYSTLYTLVGINNFDFSKINLASTTPLVVLGSGNLKSMPSSPISFGLDVFIGSNILPNAPLTNSQGSVVVGSNVMSSAVTTFHQGTIIGCNNFWNNNSLTDLSGVVIGYGINVGRYAGGAAPMVSNPVIIGNSLSDNITQVYRSVLIGPLIGNHFSGSTSTMSWYDVIIGAQAGPLYATTSGSGNTLIGYRSGYVSSSAVNGSTHNTAIGCQAWYGSSLGTAAFSNSTCIGYNSTPSASNQITLGNTSITALRCKVTSITSLSDSRVKEDIELADIKRCLEDVNRLPVSRYKYKDFTGVSLDTHVTGWMADDYEKVFPKGVTLTDESYPVLDEEGNQLYEDYPEENPFPKMFTLKDVKSITPTEALPTLWGAVQELSLELNQALDKIKELESKLPS